MKFDGYDGKNGIARHNVCWFQIGDGEVHWNY